MFLLLGRFEPPSAGKLSSGIIPTGDTVLSEGDVLLINDMDSDPLP